MHPSCLNRDDEYYMKLAYNLALKAWALGEVPIGAIAVTDGCIVGQAHNMVETMKDPTAHAEILAITQAANKIGDWRLNGTTLYVTKEPCPMCAGACIMSRVSRVVFGASDPAMGFMGGAIKLHETGVLNHSVQVDAPVLQEECAELLKTFFALKRKVSDDNALNPRE